MPRLDGQTAAKTAQHGLGVSLSPGSAKRGNDRLRRFQIMKAELLRRHRTLIVEPVEHCPVVHRGKSEEANTAVWELPQIGPGATDLRVQREVYLGNLRHAAREAGKHGISLLIEPINGRDMPGYFLNSQAQAHALREESGEPNAGLVGSKGMD